uniref:Uncharacterized protein LOC113787189 n=1 Tax=Cicer arietinum TaxID=3827 RepID=A0A3Q7Y273_CICAR|nr:uncharacterized protein LOC113787189 [Cicer arietinum]
MMGFSLVVPFGSVIAFRATHETRINFNKLFCTTHHNNATHTPIFVTKQNSIKLEIDRKSPNQVKEEIKQCYELINRLGRGIVYLGSSRMGSSPSHYVQVQSQNNNHKLYICA